MMLLSNSHLQPALQLYASMGFEYRSVPAATKYEVADVFMVLDLVRAANDDELERLLGSFLSRRSEVAMPPNGRSDYVSAAFAAQPEDLLLEVRRVATRFGYRRFPDRRHGRPV